MKTALIGTQPIVRTAIIDLVLLTVACAIPALSHLMAYPLYHLNPMLLVLLAGLLLVRERLNAYILALLLPMVSCFTVGMPTFLTALCMVAEFSTVVFLSGLLTSGHARFHKSLGVMLVAILGGKVVYYLLKALLLAPVVLVSTPVSIQILSVVMSAFLFSVLQTRKA